MQGDNVNELAKIIRDSQIGGQIARENNNFAKPTYGTITDIERPRRKGDG